MLSMMLTICSMNSPPLLSNSKDCPVVKSSKRFCLTLFKMPLLKGWWRGLSWMEMEAGGGCLVNDTGTDVILPSFPRLRELIVGHCKSMTYFPPCPHLKELDLYSVNDALNFCMKEGLHNPSPVTSTSTASSLSSSSHNPSLCLEYLNIDNPRVFNILFEDFVGGAVHVQIDHFVRVESMGTVSKGFEKCESSIRHLTLNSCKELTTLSGSGIEHLLYLKSLTIEYCENLDLEYLDCWGARHITLENLSSLSLVGLLKLETLPWRFIHLSSLESLQIEWCCNLEVLGECIGHITTLRSLQIEGCHNLKALPECLKSLTPLKFLHISYCSGLKSLPEAMRHLTSLTTLKIIYASEELVKRCQKPDGEDWPKVCHIPDVYVTGHTGTWTHMLAKYY
ncbi:putative disease resistance protein RGA3 isoform X2 [Chenopodium quinoa]|uniref:putative disease resistance protein RGA3 isoform X2 n=1 Tax=Chenopodium quinoa TaxID=63459 RepID=UPI000B77EB51|nr:putative disease resistance protein RGA3 isoform X2 [Chenopodium quinoa]